MYTSITDLPTSTHNLPYNGKRIYLKFFNRAYEKSHSDVTASKVAWQAVKRKYTKRNNEWVARKDANKYDTTTTSSSDTDGSLYDDYY
jgi:cation transport regulator ChaB